MRLVKGMEDYGDLKRVVRILCGYGGGQFVVCGLAFALEFWNFALAW